MRSATRSALVAAVLIPVASTVATAPARAATPTVLEIATVPVLAGAELEVGGVRFVTDREGNATITLPGVAEGLPRLNVIDDASERTDRELRFSRWWGVGSHGKDRRRAKAIFDVYQRVTWSYVEEADGRTVSPALVSSLVVRSSHGSVHEFGQPEPVWLHAERVVLLAGGLIEKDIDYHVESVLVDGAEVVIRGQQSFTPTRQPHWQIDLLFFDARFSALDAALGSPLTGGIRIEYPSKQVVRYELDSRGEVTLWLPRGTYRALVEAPGMQVWTPVALSRDQTIPIKVLTYVDMGLGAATLAGIAFGLLLVGRPHLVTGRSAPRPEAARHAGAAVAPPGSTAQVPGRVAPAATFAGPPGPTPGASLPSSGSLTGRRPVPPPLVAQAAVPPVGDRPWCPKGCPPSSPGAQFCWQCGARRVPGGATAVGTPPVGSRVTTPPVTTPRVTSPTHIQVSEVSRG